MIDPECNSIGDRIFFCATPWKIKEDEHSIFVTYGRSNPSKLFKSMARLKFNTKIESEELNEKNVTIEVVEPIWDSESIDINDCYIMDRSFNLKKIKVNIPNSHLINLLIFIFILTIKD